MSKILKIVVIGGGSSYTPELIEGFIKRYDELPIEELHLVDIEEGKEKLRIITELSERMVIKAGVPLKIFSSLDRKSSLKNATFVITQLRVGQLDARVLDERIPAAHQMIGQETLGPGGLFKALRTVPVIFDIIEDMKKVCPEAWLINFTNPAGIVSEAVFRYAEFDRFIGVCNVPINLTNHFAKILKTKPSELIPYFGGLNHMSYAFHVYYRNKDKLDKIIEHLKDEQVTMNNIDPASIDVDFIKNLGLYPSPYHKYYYLYEEMYQKYLKQIASGETRAEQVKKLEKSLFEKYQDIHLAEKPKELESRGGAYYSDVACSIISSIFNDKKEYHVVNTINNGYITDLPYGCAVEITSRITAHGPIPVYIGKLPDTVKGLVQSMKTFEILLVDAIYEKSLEKAKFALQVHPLTKSIKDASLVFDELVEAHRKYLNYYFED